MADDIHPLLRCESRASSGCLSRTRCAHFSRALCAHFSRALFARLLVHLMDNLSPLLLLDFSDGNGFSNPVFYGK